MGCGVPLWLPVHGVGGGGHRDLLALAAAAQLIDTVALASAHPTACSTLARLIAAGLIVGPRAGPGPAIGPGSGPGADGARTGRRGRVGSRCWGVVVG